MQVYTVTAQYGRQEELYSIFEDDHLRCHTRISWGEGGRSFLFNEIRELSGSMEAEFQYTLRGVNEVEDILTKNGAHRKELYAGLMLQFL